MPCRSGWETPEELAKYAEESRIYNEKKRKEETRNLALLLQEVLILNGQSANDINIYKTKENPSLDETDMLTDKMCSILRNADEGLITKINSSEHALYIGAWWNEHKKLDEKNNRK